jgi:hypothetical protein
VKIPLKKSPTGGRGIPIADGRHVGVVVQSVHVGLQPAFDKDAPPISSIGIAIEFAQNILARTITISQHPSSLFVALQHACGLGDADELELGHFLGKPAACEIENTNGWPKIRRFDPVEAIDVLPTARSPLIEFDVELLERGEGRDDFLKLHPDIRRAISQRVRVRS